MSAGRFLVFFVLLLVALGGINLQVFRWARNGFQLGPRGRRRLKAVLWLSLAGTVLGRVAGRYWPGTLTTFVVASASTAELAVIISGILLLVVDAARALFGLPAWLGRRLGRPSTKLATASAPAPESQPEPALPVPAALLRRTFLTRAAAGSAFLIGGGSSLYGALKGRHDYSIEVVPFKLPGLPRALDGFSIAQLSDVHIGVYVGEAELRVAEELLRKAKPDLIVLTGDLLDSDARLAELLGRFVRRLTPLARAGVVAISGNHDYFAGVEEMASAVTRAGARMLRNEGMVIGEAGAQFGLLGVDDVYARRDGGGPDLPRALASLRSSANTGEAALDLPRVLLCHNPSFFAESAGKVGLQLSGHTHGGQINLGLRPADYLLPGGWVAGRYDQSGSALYVNRGFGTVGPPVRLGAPPEVTRIVLTA